LAQHPDVQAKLHAEIGDDPVLSGLSDLKQYRYAQSIIEETLRLYPAGWLMTRRALGDDQLGPYFVPAGTEIYVPTYIIQRHPLLWSNPDRFEPERFDVSAPNRHPLALLPFSAGPRNCIGEHLARAEMQVHLVMIASRLRFVNAAPRPLELDLGVNLRNKHDFIMQFVAHRQSKLV